MPGDVLDQMLMRGEGISTTSVDYGQQKEKLAKRLNLDKPLFYFSVTTLAECQSEKYFSSGEEEETFLELLNNSGSYTMVADYFFFLQNVDQQLRTRSLNHPFTKSQLKAFDNIVSLKHNADENYIAQIIKQLQIQTQNDVFFKTLVAEIQQKWEALNTNRKPWKSFVPVLNFHSVNQFHLWFFGGKDSKGVLSGNFGTSYFTGKPVLTIIKEKIGWSVTLSSLSILIAYIISIPLATLVVYRNKKIVFSLFDYLTSILYAIPVYLMGVMLLYLFSNPDVINVFPSSGVGPLDGFGNNTSRFEKIAVTLQHLVLPLICYTYAVFAFVAAATRRYLIHEIKLPYVKTAYAKGLSSYAVIGKHALKNAVLPLVIVFTNVFPAMISGSVIIETLFSIPGMGLEIFNAAVSRNYPVIAAVFFFTSMLTFSSFVLSDFLVSKLDPRTHSASLS